MLNFANLKLFSDLQFLCTKLPSQDTTYPTSLNSNNSRAAMKRKGAEVLTKLGKRQRVAAKGIREADSIYDQAAPYLLATAKFPIDALTSEWNLGANRPIDPAHKRRLRQIFDEAGVLRRDRSHRLQVACSKAQVQQMLDYLSEDGQAQAAATAAESAEEGDSKWPSFAGWVSVVGAKVELIAGHHRIEAFKEYLQRRGLPEEERWWVCSIYDKGFSPCTCQASNKLTQKVDTLPSHLRIQLRANREDVILPDNHGQIWTELATLSSENGELFKGSSKSVEQEMLEHLRLSSRVKFPVRRLATLWRNLSWKPMITRWCRTLIGQATFNISTFEWMASCRIDDVSAVCIQAQSVQLR